MCHLALKAGWMHCIRGTGVCFLTQFVLDSHRQFLSKQRVFFFFLGHGLQLLGPEDLEEEMTVEHLSVPAALRH